MQFVKRSTSTPAARVNRAVESALNRVVRTKDGLLSFAHLGGRKAAYDDLSYEFEGGPGADLLRKHYERSLRLLWKAEDAAPWVGHRDCTPVERELRDAAYRVMDDEEKAELARLSTDEFKAMLKREYTERERKALVAILGGIGHGEAYAWLVSAELLGEVQSTGARAALSCQVLEEAKHFLVLRELLRAFDVDIPRQSAWEYVLMEDVLKARPTDKLFGMNIVIESIALSFFGLVSDWPGMEIIRLFHRDEARHAAMPSNYLASFPLPDKEQNSLRARVRRLKMVLPAIAFIPHIEEEMAELGVDAFEFGGSVIRRIAMLSERNGYRFPVSNDKLMLLLEAAFNAYCKVTRDDHELCRFMEANLTSGAVERAAELEIFGA
jgi:hypothetical protein